MSVAGSSDTEQDDGGESDSSLPSLEALVARLATPRRDNASRRDPNNSPKDRDLLGRRAAPTLDRPCRETDTDGDASLVSPSSWPAVSSIAQADDATWSCEASRKTSPGNGDPDRPAGAASAVSNCPGTPGSCDSSSRPQGQGFGMETGTPCGSEAVSPGTPGNCDSSSRPQEQGVSVEIGTPCQRTAGSPSCEIGTRHHMPKSLRRRSSRQHVNISAYVEQDSDATSESGDADNESDARPPKHRKLSVSTKQRSQQGASLLSPTDVNPSVHTATSHSTRNIPSPPPSRRPSHTRPARTTGAKFEEWHLPNATLKRVLLGNGRTTFQLQFDWDSCEDGRPAACPNSNGTQSPASRKGGRRRREAALRVSFTPEEEELLIHLKEGKDGLTWAAVHEQFSAKYPERRSQASLQVHYSTKLKRRTGERVSQESVATDSGLAFSPDSPTVPVDPALWDAYMSQGD